VVTLTPADDQWVKVARESSYADSQEVPGRTEN